MKTKITFLKNYFNIIVMVMLSSIAFSQTVEVKYEFATDGNLDDTSGNNRTLTKTGSALNTFVTDNDDNATSAFDANDASGEYLVATGYKGIDGNGARTVAAWVNLRAGGNRRTIVSWGTNSGGKMFNVMIHSGKVRVEGGASSLLSANTIPNGEWHHVAVTFDPADGGKLTDCKMYIDGAITAQGSNYQGSTVINTETTTNDLRIGEAIYSTAHYYRGALNDVTIYSEALTSAQIATLAGATASEPVAEFSADKTTANENEIITFTDASTNEPSSWVWDFGDVNAIGNRTAQNPQVSYPSAGTYTVTLTVSNAGGSDDIVKTNYITVNAGSGSGALQTQYNFDGDITDASTFGRNLITQGSFTPAYEDDHNSNASSALTASGTYADHLISGYGGISGNNSRTVTAWFKTAGTSREPIVSWGTNSAGKMFNVMIDGSSGNPRIEGGASNLQAVHPTTPVAYNDDAWHHIAVTYDAADGDGSGMLSNCKIYIDGELLTNNADGSGSFASSTVLNTETNSNFLKIGSAVYSTFTFHGAIDDVRIYSKTLTESEITTVMNGGTLGVKDVAFDANELKVYPNQVEDILNIQTTVSKNVNVKIYNILGKLVKNTNTKEVNMTNLSPGLYIVKVRAGTKVADLKIIKK